jgi:EAL domain-containing protein (putative c-di-GMP-specific phosphodiesterase class I)
VAETVAHVLRETGLPPERLELEITESLLINDTEEVFGKLNRLRHVGVKIVMDDFGTAIRASAISRVSPSTSSRSTGSSCAT